MIDIEPFSKEISDFQKTGKYDYEFDEGGNLIFNKTSSKFNQIFLSLPLANYGYDINKIKSFYDLNFLEFVPTTKLVENSNVFTEQDRVQLSDENAQLKIKLDELVDLSNNNSSDSEKLAVKQVIVSLRIQLKQGSADRDFSNEFPYLPVTKKN